MSESNIPRKRAPEKIRAPRPRPSSVRGLLGHPYATPVILVLIGVLIGSIVAGGITVNLFR